MRYIILFFALVTVCFVIGWLGTRLIKAKLWKNMDKVGRILLNSGISLIVFILLAMAYLSDSHNAEEEALKKALSNSSVDVKEIDGGYVFDGPGDGTALIFYQGAKVEALAYAPLMTKIAEVGVDCFVADMPFNIAAFDTNRADRFINNYQYDEWIAMGHSMGGLVISNYVTANPDRFSKLILLASYPSKPIDDGVLLYSIYGSNDECLNRDNYEKCKTNWPSDAREIVIKGGNHSQFGNYGGQSIDGVAEISADEQQRVTAECVIGK